MTYIFSPLKITEDVMVGYNDLDLVGFEETLAYAALELISRWRSPSALTSLHSN